MYLEIDFVVSEGFFHWESNYYNPVYVNVEFKGVLHET